MSMKTLVVVHHNYEKCLTKIFLDHRVSIIITVCYLMNSSIVMSKVVLDLL